MTHDLTTAASEVTAGRLCPEAAIEHSLEASRSPACRHAFVRLFESQARGAAQAVNRMREAGGPVPRLAGLSVSVKDLFDVAGQPTTGGSRVLESAPPASRDAAAVQRLRAAGAALLGHTNLTEFAFSGVGINPHHGTPVNPATAALDDTPRIPGGSSSGAAVSVSTGAAWAALGSDTGGSLRIPAALQGLVGFKGTQDSVPREGCIPLSPTLDTAGAITRSVRDTVLLHEVLAHRTVSLPHRPLSHLNIGVPQGELLQDLDPTVARALERTLQKVSAAGARLHELHLPAPGVIAQGGFSAAESWHWHRHHLARAGQDYDPRVALRIRRGEAISAADYLDLHQARAAWIAGMRQALAAVDVCLSPTVPIVAPPIAPLERDDELFFRTNALLLRNPSVVNLLDGCALSLPMHLPGELPTGLMLWHFGGRDEAVLDAGLAVEQALKELT